MPLPVNLQVPNSKFITPSGFCLQGPTSQILTSSGPSSAAELFYEDIFPSVFSGPTFFPVDDLIRSGLVFMV
jgi:hypothetical protein